MSADTTMVIAAYNFGTTEMPRVMYTARVVENASEFQDVEYKAYRKAVDVFLSVPSIPNVHNQFWFSTLGRAKTLASLLREEVHIENTNLMYIEIVDQGVYPLTHKGKRTSWDNRDLYRPQPRY